MVREGFSPHRHSILRFLVYCPHTKAFGWKLTSHHCAPCFLKTQAGGILDVVGAGGAENVCNGQQAAHGLLTHTVRSDVCGRNE